MTEITLREEGSTQNKNFALLLANIILGLILWFGLCSDYSWNNVWVNVVFPPIVGLVGVVSYFKNRKDLTPKEKKIQSLSCLPSIIGGIPYLLLIVIAIVPPFLLATMFWFDEQTSATLIQKAESPNGAKIAEVYFRPVGAYSGGSGRIEVHLTYKWLPFVKRDVYYVRVTHADENTHNYLSWTDENTLFIPETDESVKINPIEWRVPSMITIPINLFLLFFRSS